MKASDLIKLLQDEVGLVNGHDIDVHVYNRDGDIKPITGADTQFTIRGDKQFLSFYLFSEPQK